MANRRIQKKRQKQQQIQKVQSYGTYKKPEKLTQTELTQIITKETKKENRRQSQAKYRQKQKTLETRKRMELERVSGIPMEEWGRGTLTKLKKYSLKDIENGKFSIADFPELYNAQAIDFDKEYTIPDGKKLSFAFRSLNGDIDISDILHHYMNYSITELIQNIRSLVNKPLTASRNIKGKKGRNVGSSGKAGEGRTDLLSPGSFQELYAQQYNENRRANTKAKKLSKSAAKKGIGFQHSGIDYHWQYISQQTEDGRYKAYTKISIRKLLVIGNAILDNIREDDRQGFYNSYKSACITCIPIMEKILP